MSSAVVVCVLRSGGDFLPEHAIRLVEDLGKYWAGHFVCLTNFGAAYHASWPPYERRPLLRPYPGWWSKLELCAPEQDGLGDIWYCDLDTVVVGDVTELIQVGQLTMLQDFMRPRLASGVMYLPVDARREAWKAWKSEGPVNVMRRCHRGGDQQFFEEVWGTRAATYQALYPGQIVSYKKDVVRAGAGWGHHPNVRLICFHGKPRPWELTRDQLFR